MSTEFMPRVRELVEVSGLTLQAIGERMGYPPGSARKSVSQFLRSEHPSLDLAVRFCKAMGVNVEELL